MNNLSWVIYLAEAVPSLVDMVLFISVLATVAFAVYALVGSIGSADTYSWDTPQEVENKKAWWNEKKYLPPRWLAVTILSTWVVLSLAPSKETIYLIAGSEAAEAVVTSETGQQILNDIQQIIKHQLGHLKGEAK